MNRFYRATPCTDYSVSITKSLPEENRERRPPLAAAVGRRRPRRQPGFGAERGAEDEVGALDGGERRQVVADDDGAAGKVAGVGLDHSIRTDDQSSGHSSLSSAAGPRIDDRRRPTSAII